MGNGKTASLSVWGLSRGGVETELRLREPSGERSTRGSENEVRDVVLPSHRALNKCLIWVRRKTQLKGRIGEGGKRRGRNSRSLRKQWSLKVAWVEEGTGGGYRAIFIPSLSVEVVCVCVWNVSCLRAFANHRPWLEAFVWLPRKINNKPSSCWTS